ncbi:MAG: helix-turn-helix domain-containing protein [Polyangiaceae bacterium]
MERTRAGLERARREGKRIGRPKRMDSATLARAISLRDQGRSLRAIAMALKVPRATVARALSSQGDGALVEATVSKPPAPATFRSAGGSGGPAGVAHKRSLSGPARA